MLFIPWWVSADSSVDVLENRISGFLVQAERALAADRLTTPTSDNAMAYIDLALSLAPNHPRAFKLLRRITKRYGELVAQSLKSGERAKQRSLERARSFRDRAESVVVQHGLADHTLLDMEQNITHYQYTYPNRGLMFRGEDGSPNPATTEDKAAGPGQPSNPQGTRQRVRDLIDSHILLGEAALQDGYLDKAKQHRLFAQELALQYGIQEPRLDDFSIQVSARKSWISTPSWRLFGTF